MEFGVAEVGDELSASNELAGKEAPVQVMQPWRLYGSAQRWLYLAVLFLVTTSNYFDYFVLSVILEPIKKEFHVSDTQLGLLTGFSFALFYVAAALPIAHWADRGNRRTVMSVCLVAWSFVTAACGFARSFWQLVASRMLIGAVEPGGVPPAQSLAADYFPPERRATALILLSQGGAAMGYLVGIGVGGYVAAKYGWRCAFLVAGVPGIALAAIVRLVLPEPRQQMPTLLTSEQPKGSFATLAQLVSKRSYLLALLGMSIFVIYSYGIAVFLPSLMIRSLHATLEQVSVTWGVAMSVANLSGACGGGWLADTLSRRDVRWYAWLPMLACVLALPLYFAVLSSDSLPTFISIEFVAEVILSAGVPAIYAAVHAVCGSQSRAMAMAVLQFCVILFGGVGPLIAGLFSDAFAAVHGTDSLRTSLTVMLGFLIPAALAFYATSVKLPSELEV